MSTEGPIIDQAAVPIDPGDTHESLAGEGARGRARAAAFGDRPAERGAARRLGPMELWEIQGRDPADAAEATELALLESGCEGGPSSRTRSRGGHGSWGSSERGRGRAGAGRSFCPDPPAKAPSEPARGGCPTRTGRTATGSTSRRGPSGGCTGSRVGAGDVSPSRGPFGALARPGDGLRHGNHETTRLCIERLVEFEAGLAGAGPAKDSAWSTPAAARESSPFRRACSGSETSRALTTTRRRPRQHRERRAERASRAASGSPRRACPTAWEGASAGVVLANIQADVLVRHARALAAAVAPGGILG
jgi:hypothetical protein